MLFIEKIELLQYTYLVGTKSMLLGAIPVLFVLIVDAKFRLWGVVGSY